MNSKSINKTISFLLIVFTFVALQTFSAKAEDTYTLLAPLPCIDTPKTDGVDAQGKTIEVPEKKCPGGNLSIKKEIILKDYLQYAVNLFIALASVAAVFMIVRGGFLYMTSTIPGMKNDGLAMVKNAIIGLLMVLCSYIILRTIDPRLVNLPSTIVPPLELSNKLTDKTDDFFTQLKADAEILKTQNAELKKAIATAESENNRVETAKADVEEQIALLTGLSDLTSTEIDNLCSDGSTGDSELDALCADRAQLINNSGKLKGDSVTMTAEELMNRVIIACSDQNSTIDLKTCQDQIDLYSKDYKGRLAGLGQSDTEQKIDDYAVYAKEMPNIAKLAEATRSRENSVGQKITVTTPASDTQIRGILNQVGVTLDKIKNESIKNQMIDHVKRILISIGADEKRLAANDY